MVDFAAHTARLIARVGQDVTVTPSVGPVRTIKAVFSAEPVEALGIEGFGPKLRAMWSDVSDLAVGNAVTIAGADFTISAMPERDRVVGDILIPLESA